jgi:hypothetical protein
LPSNVDDIIDACMSWTAATSESLTYRFLSTF